MRCVIYYFSGTGNTKRLADYYKASFNKNGIDCDLVSIESVLKDDGDIDISQYDLIGIGFPVHSFNAPQLVVNFTRLLPNTINKKAFIFYGAAGGDFLLNRGSSILVMRYLLDKHFDIISDRIYTTPSNFVITQDTVAREKIYKSMQSEATATVKQMLNGEVAIDYPKTINYFISLLGRIEWLGAKTYGKDLKANDSCNSCGLCEKSCPTANIKLKNNKPHFGFKCALCMRCMNICPQKAIKPRLYGFTLPKNSQ